MLILIFINEWAWPVSLSTTLAITGSREIKPLQSTIPLYTMATHTHTNDVSNTIEAMGLHLFIDAWKDT